MPTLCRNTHIFILWSNCIICGSHDSPDSSTRTAVTVAQFMESTQSLMMMKMRVTMNLHTIIINNTKEPASTYKSLRASGEINLFNPSSPSWLSVCSTYKPTQSSQPTKLCLSSSEIAHWIKAMAAKSDGLSSSFKTHMMAGESQLNPANWPLTPHMHCGMIHRHA